MQNKLDKWISDLRKLNIFGTKDDLSMPVHGSNKNNGVSIGSVNMSVLISVVWLLCSVGMFGLGIWHCRNRSSYYALKCDKVDCFLIQNRNEPINYARRSLF